MARDTNPPPAMDSPRIPALVEFPAMYNETYVRALPRDPNTLFAFWEIGPDELKKIETTKPRRTTHLLRLYEIGEREGRTSPGGRAAGDSIVEKTADSRYIRVPEPGHRYQLEYGVMSSKGSYTPISRSKEVEVPAGRAREAAGETARSAAERLLFDMSARSSVVTPAPEARHRGLPGDPEERFPGSGESNFLEATDSPPQRNSAAAGDDSSISSRFISW